MNILPPAPHFTRRSILKAAGLAGATGAAGALAACAPGSATPGSGATDALTVGFVPIACSAPLLIADAEGLFTRHGVTVQMRKYSGWADLWTAYATGELDVAHMLSPMPVAINAGATDATRPTELAFTQNTNG
uniref:ABC transporter substrate-binding protein n=1 Tax=Corynebacterium sp. TaxID=1720 RepID=UPI003735DCF9